MSIEPSPVQAGAGTSTLLASSPATPIPFNRPFVPEASVEYMLQAARSAKQCGDGPFTDRCHAHLRQVLGSPKVLLTTSCTDALEMSALLLGLSAADEVIVPSFTFVSSANAFALRGARIRFADIRPDTLNLDEAQLESLITPRTRAIVVVHYAGVGCEMDAINAIARRHGLFVIEDNAHGLFGKYRGRWLGTLGAMATLSFHETKNLSCGEGGALLINDPVFNEHAEIAREKGTNRSRYIRGQVDKYTWVDLGSSYLPSDILAAMLLGQLEAAESIQRRRATIWNTYDTHLRNWARRHGIQTPFVPSDREQAYHMYYLLLPDLETRQRFISHLRQQDITAAFHYLPLHSSPCGVRASAAPAECPITSSVSDRLVRLPFHNSLTVDEQARVIDAVTAFAP